jgi:beta-lactam-binding protein with PASTA domain
VIGLKLTRAKAKIRSSRCAVGAVRRRRSVANRVGRVIAQSPRAGVVRRAGARVNLTVGRR